MRGGAVRKQRTIALQRRDRSEQVVEIRRKWMVEIVRMHSVVRAPSRAAARLVASGDGHIHRVSDAEPGHPENQALLAEVLAEDAAGAQERKTGDGFTLVLRKQARRGTEWAEPADCFGRSATSPACRCC